MKLPKKIEVLNRTYKVVESDMSEGSSIGSAKFSTGMIVIDSNSDSQLQADTLLHEIIHAILTAMGHEISEKEGLHTEENVLIISNGLAAFLRDNPETFKEIIKSLN